MTNAIDELVIEQDNGLAILRLNRPERLNALSPGILRRMETEVPRLVAAPEVRAIMITGKGRAFCAGGDVGGMGGPQDAEITLAGMRAYHSWLKALWTSEKLVITAINGAAAGGGFGLAMIGDLVVASEGAFFKAAFTSLGAAADYGLAFTLPRVVGSQQAAEILFCDRRIGAQEALRIGLVSRVFPADTFAEDALEFARAVSRSSRAAQLTKRLLRLNETDAFSRFLEVEARTQAEAFQSRDFLEGVAAFRENRPPVFHGC
jgi:2-(1,2-epoxy-1,2-dihydrophenyl)acetyl-CoA isomerase